MHIKKSSVTLAENDTLTVTLPMGAVIVIQATPQAGQPELFVSYKDEDRGYRIVQDNPLEEVELD